LILQVSHQTEAAPEGTWEDFTQESSMHGIRFMKRDVSIIRRYGCICLYNIFKQ